MKANNGKDRKDLYTDNWDGAEYKGPFPASCLFYHKYTDVTLSDAQRCCSWSIIGWLGVEHFDRVRGFPTLGFDGVTEVPVLCREPCQRALSHPCNQLPGFAGGACFRILVVRGPVGMRGRARGSGKW